MLIRPYARVLFAPFLAGLLLPGVWASAQGGPVPAIPSVATGAVQAQAGQAPSDAPYRFSVNVRQTLIDVVVTNSKGPVLGLQQQDFSLQENGQKQKIIYFAAHTGNPPAEAVKKPVALPPGVYTNLPATPPNDTLTVLLIDGLNTSIVDQPYVRAQMQKYLSNIQSGTRVAVFTLGHRLRYVQGFTSDPTALAQALKSKVRNYFGNIEAGPSAPESPDLSLGQAIAVDDALSSLSAFEGEMAQTNLLDRNEITTEAFQELAAYLSNFRGRKNVIWFADQFPLFVGAEFVPFVAQNGGALNVKESVATTPNLERREITNMLAAAQIAVYPVDAGGLKPTSAFSAARGGTPDIALSLSNDFARDAGKHDAMNQLAAETGGKAYYNTNALDEVVKKVTDAGTNYYTLGYVPPAGVVDGRFRKIVVNVSGKNLTLSYRKGYFSDSPAVNAIKDVEVVKENVEQTNTLYRTMRRGAPDMTGILFKVRIVPSRRDPANLGALAGDETEKLKGQSVPYRIDWSVDLRSVNMTVQPDDGSRTATVRFAAVAFDADGNPLNSITRQIDLTLTPAEFAEHITHGFQYAQELSLPLGEVFLRLGAYDPGGNKVGSTEVPLLVKVDRGKDDVPTAPASKP